MGRPKLWENNAERMRAYRAANPGLDKRRRVGKAQPPFITIDGEAVGESGYHLLAASTGDSVDNEEGLSSADCLRFLLALKKKHGKAVYCGYSLGYDCEHWIRDFGPILWKQFREHSEGDIVLDGIAYTIAYVPRKWFKIRLQGANEFQNIISVWDVFSFFQSSFVNAVGGPFTGQEDGWGAATPEEMEMFIKWKALRGRFTWEDWEEVKEYNQMECRALVRLMGKLREAFLGIDINLSQWHGPGTVAKALLKRYNMTDYITSPSPEVEDAIARSYFGGRFEVFEFGQIENVYDYDISSAYPAATSLLPSSCGEWQRVSTYQGDESLWALYLCSWKVDTDLRPFPWRDGNGCIHYPAYGRGWYWGWEVAVARRGWGDAIRIEDGWSLHPLEEGVFAWIVDLAQQRVQAKQAAKEATGEEKERLSGIARAYKLALNSVYGVLIQTVGKRKSQYLCPMWAALITANTRSKLLSAALADPEHVVCFATDGLFTKAINPAIVDGKGLGDWELKSDGLHLELYQSGCYSIWKDGELTCAKFRGVSQDALNWDVLRDEWRKAGGLGSVEMPTKRFYGHRTALARNKPELQCAWVSDKKNVDLKPGNGFFRDLGADLGQPSMGWSAMTPGVNYEEVSSRYKKLKPGETEAEIEEQEVQP